jgi:hypothetical protein
MQGKQTPRFADGKVFIFLPDLPIRQRELFSQWAPKDTIYTVRSSGRIFEGCADYMIYAFWFDKHFSSSKELALELML